MPPKSKSNASIDGSTRRYKEKEYKSWDLISFHCHGTLTELAGKLTVLSPHRGYLGTRCHNHDSTPSQMSAKGLAVYPNLPTEDRRKSRPPAQSNNISGVETNSATWSTHPLSPSRVLYSSKPIQHTKIASASMFAANRLHGSGSLVFQVTTEEPHIASWEARCVEGRSTLRSWIAVRVQYNFGKKADGRWGFSSRASSLFDQGCSNHHHHLPIRRLPTPTQLVEYIFMICNLYPHETARLNLNIVVVSGRRRTNTFYSLNSEA